MTEKYFINEDKETREVVALFCIANELAEKNRLKRLELFADNKLETGDMEEYDIGKKQ